jgi:hypothetical protein
MKTGSSADKNNGFIFWCCLGVFIDYHSLSNYLSGAIKQAA